MNWWDCGNFLPFRNEVIAQQSNVSTVGTARHTFSAFLFQMGHCMSTAPENDWRAQALQNMEQAEREQIAPPHMTSTS